jgi:hypothetical protein
MRCIDVDALTEEFGDRGDGVAGRLSKSRTAVTHGA